MRTGVERVCPQLGPQPVCPQPEQADHALSKRIPHTLPEPACLYKRGYTEARCVYEYHYGLTDQRMDALQHLVNICLKKAFGRYRRFWSPKPRVKFVGVATAWKDWESYDWGNERKNTKGWLLAALPGWIECYSPEHCTLQELFALVRFRDPHLLHVCQRLLDRMRSESRRREIACVEFQDGFDNDDATAYFGTDDDPAQFSYHQRAAPTELKQNYGDMIRLLVRDSAFRKRYPTLFRTLEATLRKLDSGLQRKQAIDQIASESGRKPSAVERELRRVKGAMSSPIRQALSGVL